MNDNKVQDDYKFNYFAFISYNRKNLAAAEFIQNALEHYRYPRESIAKKLWPNDQEYVRKIFLDKSHLSGRGEKFEAQLIEALSQSRYLIVVCSPESAEIKNDSNKHYVNWEIETFLKIHGKDALSRIIPVIYKGEPDLSNSSCLPLPIRIVAIAQRNLPDMRPAGKAKEYFWNRKQHWFQAIITLLTYTFDVERSIIFDRFEAERAKQRTKIIISSAVILIFLILLTTWFVLERNRAWVETEKNKAQLQISENQKQDAVARISFNEALKIIQSNSKNNNRSLALLHLANSWRLPEAKRRASLFLQQTSWLIPIETTAGKTMPPADFTLPSLDSEIETPQNIPQGYPLTFKVKNGILQATLTSSNKILWKKTNQWGILSLNISPDGRFMMLLKTMPSFAVEAYDPFTGRFMWRKELENLPVKSAFSPDGMRFAVLQQNMGIRIFRNDNGKNEFEYCRFPNHTWKIEFTDDSNNILAISPEQSVKYTLLKQTMDIPVLSNWRHPVSAYCVSPSKKLLILAGQTAKAADSSSILICEAASMKKISTIDVKGYTHTMVVSDNEKLLAAIHDQTFVIYDISEPQKIKAIFKHSFSHAPDRLLFDKDSKKCYIAGNSSKVWCWDRNLKSCVPTTFADSSVIKSIAWGKQGELITCGKELLFWDVDNKQRLKSLSLRGNHEKITVTNQYIICASRLLRQVVVYNPIGEKLWQTNPYSEPGVIPFALLEDSNLIAIAESRNSVRVLELATGEPVTEKIITDKKINSLQFCSNNADETKYLFIGGGDVKQGFYTVYDVDAHDIVYQTTSGNSSIDCFLELKNNLVFISGTSNSKHSVFELPTIKEYDLEAFRLFFENYTGASINQNGVTREKTVSVFDRSQTENIFPSAMKPASQRMIKKGILASDVASMISEQDYHSASEALYLSPNNIVAMKNFWMRTARMLAVKNHQLHHPEKTVSQLEMDRANYTASDWAVFIFTDPQALYFADYFTKQMVKLHPGHRDVQRARNDFLRLTGRLTMDQTAIEQEKAKIRNIWMQLAATPANAKVEQIHAVAMHQLKQNCKSIDDIQKYLNELAILLTRNSDMNVLNLDYSVMICDLISKNYAVCKYIPEGSSMFAAFLQKIIDGIQNAKPEGIKKQLLFDLNACLAETYFCIGNFKAGQEAMVKAKDYSHASFTAAYTLPYLQVLCSITSGQDEEAEALWDKFLGNELKEHIELAAVMSKQLWKSLEMMKRNGVILGNMGKIRLHYREKFNTGTVIKVVPGRTAEKMGWKSNDKIIEFAGFPVTSSEDLAGILFSLDISPEGSKIVSVKLKQEEEVREYKIKTKQKLGFMY